MADVNRAGVSVMNIILLENLPDFYPITARTDENWIGATVKVTISNVEKSPPTHVLTVGHGVTIESAKKIVIAFPALEYRDYHFLTVCITPLTGEPVLTAGKIFIKNWRQ